MAHLPPGGAAETVTTTDLGSDIAAVRTELYRVVSDQTRCGPTDQPMQRGGAP